MNRDLVGDWLKAVELGINHPEYEKYEWADDFAFNLHARDEHRALWQLICDLISRAQSDHILARIGAGPLENLLSRHTRKYLTELEKAVYGSPKFKRALASVWLDAADTPLYKHVYAIAGIEPHLD